MGESDTAGPCPSLREESAANSREGWGRELLLSLLSKSYMGNAPSKGSSDFFLLLISGTLNTDLERIGSVNENAPSSNPCNAEEKRLHITPSFVSCLAGNVHSSSRTGCSTQAGSVHSCGGAKLKAPLHANLMALNACATHL